MNFYLKGAFQSSYSIFISLCFSIFTLGFAFADNHEDVEKIEVVGSHIKRVDMEGPSPIVVIDREHIEMTGYDNLGDVLGDLTISSLGNLKPNALSNLHVSGITIRSFGPGFPSTSSVLVLLDGMTLPEIGGLGGIDLNSIPISIIERVEILKDGASAIYGSNAVAGAINVVTKDDFFGTQLSTSGELAPRKDGPGELLSYFDFPNWEGLKADQTRNEWDPVFGWRGKGDSLLANVLYGGKRERLKYLTSAQFKLSAPSYLYDKSYGKLGVAKMSRFSSPGNWMDSKGNWHSDPSCPEERTETKKNNKGVEEKKCKFDWSRYMQYNPLMLQGSLYGKLGIEIDDNSSLKTALLYNYSWSKGVLAPGVSGEAFDKGKVDKRMSEKVANQQGLPEIPSKVEYRTVKEIGGGPRISVNNTHIVQLITNYKKLLGDTTEFNTYLNLGSAYFLTKGITGYLKTSKLRQLLDEDKWRMFNKEASKRYDVTSAKYVTEGAEISHSISLEPRLTGELLDIDSSFPLSYSLGGQGQWEHYLKYSDDITALKDAQGNYTGESDQWGGGEPGYGEGDRLQASLYGELLASPFNNKLEIQLAGRSDYYNDIGLSKMELPFTSLTIPLSTKLGLSYQPVEQIKLRGTLGKSFQAPSLSNLYQGKVTTYPMGKDRILCTDNLKDDNALCKGKQFLMNKMGNENLKPEIAQNLTFGIIFDPIEPLSFNLDFFHLSAKDIINGEASIDDLTRLERTDKGKKILDDYSINIQRNESGEISYIDYQPFNTSSALVQGFDFEALWSNIYITSNLDLNLKLEHTHTLYLETQTISNLLTETPAPYYMWLENLFENIFGYKNPDIERNKFKENGAPITATVYGLPRWKNSVQLSLVNKDKGHKFELVFNNFPSQLKQDLVFKNLDTKAKKENKKIEDVVEYLSYFWTIDVRASLFLSKKSRLTFGVRNLLGLNPPINDSARYLPHVSGDNVLFSNLANFNDFLHDIRGRVIHAKYSYTF